MRASGRVEPLPLVGRVRTAAPAHVPYVMAWTCSETTGRDLAYRLKASTRALSPLATSAKAAFGDFGSTTTLVISAAASARAVSSA